jgi:hypothetical protein
VERQHRFKNEGTKLPSTIESTKREKTKLDFSELASGSFGWNEWHSAADYEGSTSATSAKPRQAQALHAEDCGFARTF